ncbi:MAG: oligosaccharide flippase family protein [Ruminococcus sp.]|nr:oligosaccharide flippase family protein [Ruminococcus sp.]
MKGLSTSKQMLVNLIAAILSFSINIGISFFLTPFLVRKLGTEAYGFIGLANNFVQYATIITAALNSMSGRFIAVAYKRGDKDKASRLFSSVLVADLILAGILLVVASVFTLYLDVFLNIPENLILSVKVTFGLTFLTFVISIITAIFTTAAFVKNKLYLNSIRDIISNTLKVTLVVSLFTFCNAKLYFLATATLASGIFLLVANITVKRKILPDVKMSFRLFTPKLVYTLIAAGVWNSLGQLCNALNNGLDLLICNLTLGATMMGLLSIAKTVPNCIDLLISTIANIFTPHFTTLYATGDKERLVEENEFSSKVMSLIMTAPLAGFIAFGNKFYTLWQPTKTPEEIRIIQIISVLACVSYLFTCHSRTISSLFIVYNKLRPSVLVSFVNGILNVTIVLLLVIFVFKGNNEMSAFVIAGVSSVLISLKAIIFVPIYSAHIQGIKWTTYYPSILRGWLCFGVLIALFAFINSCTTATDWLSFLSLCVVCGAGGYVISIPLIFNTKELSKLSAMVKSKINK